MNRATVKADGHGMRLEGGGDAFRGYLSCETPEEGVELINLRIKSDEARRPPDFRLVWKVWTS